MEMITMSMRNNIMDFRENKGFCILGEDLREIY
jgi:hypothetical protein